MYQPRLVSQPAPVIAAASIAVIGLAGWGLLLGGPPRHANTPPASSFWALTHAPRIASQPTSGLMLGVYTPNLAGFDHAVGHLAGLSVCYVPWGTRYPAATVVRAAADQHAETVLEIGPNNHGLPTARQIAEGKGDGWLRWFGASIAGFGDPVAVSFEPEMNGPWHWRSWHEDPREYVAAFRHIHAVLSGTSGGGLITWLWQPSAIHVHTPDPMPWWPGSTYVDVVGLDGYYYSPADTFSRIFGRTISLVRHRTSAPIMVGETAVGPQSSHQAWGIHNLFAGIRRYRLLGLIWFDQRQHALPYHQDWRLEDNTAALAAFRAALAAAGPLAAFAPIGPRN